MQQLFDKLWALNPTGNKEAAYSYFITTVQHKKKADGTPITGEWLFDRYEEYLDNLQQFQAGKYTKKEYKIQPPLEWLHMELFFLITPVAKNPLDFYLYGL